MALIKCPECGAQVSDSAENCPKCAYPIAGGGSTQAHGGKIQTVEQTSKRYKLQQLLSVVLIAGSILLIIAGASGDKPGATAGFGVLGFMVGFIWFCIVRFMTWWHHGRQIRRASRCRRRPSARLTTSVQHLVGVTMEAKSTWSKKRFWLVPVAVVVVVVFAYLLWHGVTPRVSQPSPRPLPPEYRTLARHLAAAMNPSRDQFRDDKGMAEILAAGHSAVMSLRGVESSDKDIMYIAALADSAYTEALAHLEQIRALPEPPGAEELLVSSLVDAVFGNLSGFYARSLKAQEKRHAIDAKTFPMLAAIEKGEAAQQMLPRVAEKYSAAFCDAAGRIAVDFDESWGWLGQHDWLRVHNRGPALEDCTIAVELTGASGEVKKNVHFVAMWPEDSSMYARYKAGDEVLGRQVRRMTVTLVQKLDVTIYSPKFSTGIAYVYQGTEKDKDIAHRCKDLKFTGRYQPFQFGFFIDTQRGAEFTLDGVPFLPKCRVDLTFREGEQSKECSWELAYWKRHEAKSFKTVEGALTFDPTTIDMAISFPGSAYRHEVTLQVTK